MPRALTLVVDNTSEEFRVNAEAARAFARLFDIVAVTLERGEHLSALQVENMCIAIDEFVGDICDKRLVR